MAAPDYPVAVGVLYCEPAPAYVSDLYDQIKLVRSRSAEPDMNAILRSGHTWTVT